VETEGILFNDKEEFTLDAVGNRIQHSESNNPWQYDENNRLVKIGEGNCGSGNTICYDYDAAGNRIKKTEGNKTTSHKYDTLNRLVEVSQGNGNNEQLIARYGYDPFNRRIWKEQFGDKNGQSLAQAKRTYFLYSDEGLLAEEEQNIILNEDGSVTAASQPEITTQYGQEPDSHFSTGILFVKTKSSNNQDIIAYYHHDHLNTPIQATDKQGNVVWSANFNAFGRVTITTSVPTPEHPVIVSNLRFPGQYEDNETGLYYNWNRYYSPDEGRYVTADPIGLMGGVNLYGYVDGNPINQRDPTGLEVSGSWAPEPRFHITDHGIDLVEPILGWSWWGYVKVIRIHGYIKGYINVDVICTDECRTWEIHTSIPLEGSTHIDLGPNLYATIIGMRFGLWSAISVNIVLMGGNALYSEYKFLSQINKQAVQILRNLKENGPTAICLGS
jgi:RHS repeat-associated protein